MQYNWEASICLQGEMHIMYIVMQVLCRMIYDLRNKNAA